LKSKQSLKTKNKKTVQATPSNTLSLSLTWFRRKTIVGWLLGFDVYIFCRYVDHLFFVISERKYQILPQVVKRKNFFAFQEESMLALPTSPASCKVALDCPLGIGMEDVIFLLGGRHITVLL